MGKFIDLTGQQFGSWEVKRRDSLGKHKQILWLCQCDCGSRGLVSGSDLKLGKSKSCGCYKRNLHTIYNMCYEDTYNNYTSMMSRCYNESNIAFSNYGGRGIKVCKRWRSNPEAFHIWAHNIGYKKGLTLDRIDNDKGYSPENCRWATYKEQNSNRRNNHTLTYRGETKTLTQWSEKIGIKKSTLQRRAASGWSDEEIIITPLNQRRIGSQLPPTEVGGLWAL